MNSRQRRIASLTRDTRFLRRTALAVLAGFALFGAALAAVGVSVEVVSGIEVSGAPAPAPPTPSPSPPVPPEADPAPAPVPVPGHGSALQERDFAAVFRSILHGWVASFWWPAALAALISGAVWFTLVHSVLGLGRRDALWGIPAVLLGAASTLLTLFLLVLQEGIVGFAETGDVFKDAIYFTAGVGLREEASKLLFFLPLLPFLLRAGSPALALACASWVGLGFAIEENMGYFIDSTSGTVGSGMWSRFITANFFHLSATGLVGYALYRFAKQPARHWEMALGTFLAAVGLHGVYNYVMSNPTIAYGWSFVSIVVIGLLAYWYFGEAEFARASVRRQVVSPLAVLVIGSSVILGISLVFIILALPAGEVFSEFVYASAGVAPVAFIFVNRFRSA